MPASKPAKAKKKAWPASAVRNKRRAYRDLPVFDEPDQLLLVLRGRLLRVKAVIEASDGSATSLRCLGHDLDVALQLIQLLRVHRSLRAAKSGSFSSGVRISTKCGGPAVSRRKRRNSSMSGSDGYAYSRALPPVEIEVPR